MFSFFLQVSLSTTLHLPWKREAERKGRRVEGREGGRKEGTQRMKKICILIFIIFGKLTPSPVVILNTYIIWYRFKKDIMLKSFLFDKTDTSNPFILWVSQASLGATRETCPRERHQMEKPVGPQQWLSRSPR